MRRVASFGGVRAALAPALLGLLAAGACAQDDTTRPPTVRGSLGQELFGALCDRVGAQALHEDLTGASYRTICHPAGGAFSSTVDASLLPTQLAGSPVAGDDPAADRALGIARMERLAADRDGPLGLIAAFDATFPDVMIAVKNLGASDPTTSCNAAGQGSLHTELQNLLTRFTPLYDDRTLPHSTESLANVVTAFAGSTAAQAAYARLDSRAGYRRVDLALGAARPLLAYPKLRDLANATLSLVSPDSTPYASNASHDASGNRVPVPGSAYPQIAQLVTVAHAELANETADPVPSPLVLASTTDATVARTLLNRPRTDLEVLQSILLAQNAAFTGGPFGASAPSYLALRDPRGYVSVAPVGGALPSPFVAGADGLPAIDALGQFVTGDAGAPPPLPNVEVPDLASWARDPSGRALAHGQPIYRYVDANQSFLSVVLGHMRGAVGGKSLVDSTPADGHETLMNALAGAYVLLGPRTPGATRTYADGTKVTYDAFSAAPSPLGDLVYALGQILADPSTDATLSLASTLMSKNPDDVARTIGATIWSKDTANADTTATLPATSTFWDEIIDLVVQIAQDTTTSPGGNRMLEDVLYAFANPASAGLAGVLSSQAANLDDITYDRSTLNGPVVNATTHDASAPKTPVDRTKPDANANRSELQRFAQLVHDSSGVTMCNKEGAILHAVLSPTLIVNACASTGGNAGQLCLQPDTTCGCSGGRTFHECEVFKIDDLAKFYLDSIAKKASLYFRNKLVREGAGTAPGGIGATSAGIIEQSSAIGLDPPCSANPDGGTCNADRYNDTPTATTGPGAPGFWDPAVTVWNPTLSPPTFLRPKPAWIHRQIGFDLVGDSPTSSGPNYTTNHFLADLQGLDVGTAVCPERVIPDPCKGDPNCGTAADADVASDGNVHGLRACADGDWLYQRDQDSLFMLEESGFLGAIAPLATAFANHGREDLFIRLMEVLHEHWQTAAGAVASPDECKLTTDSTGKTTTCTKDGADTYEPLLSKIFGADLLPSLNHISSVAGGLSIPTCSAIDATSHGCTASASVDGIHVLAAAARALVDPNVAKGSGVTDSTGKVTAARNDGTTNPQVTPLYLFLEALDEVDAAFAQDAAAKPADPDPDRQAEWRQARSQLVDEIFAVQNATAANSAPPVDGGLAAAETFADPSLAKITPVLIDTLRAQLLARCGAAETAGTCAWARGSVAAAKTAAPATAMWNEMVGAVGRPTFAATLDLLDALRRNQPARAAQEDLLQYLADPASMDAAGQAEALSELTTTGVDLFQVLRDDTNLVPVYQALAAGLTSSAQFPGGPTVVDATTALLSRVAGRAFDSQGHEICANELDPNGVLDMALANVVKPLADGSGKASLTPLEVMVDAIADVNRAAPAASAPLAPPDYASISTQVTEFLTDPQRGLEQFYAVVRTATETPDE